MAITGPTTAAAARQLREEEEHLIHTVIDNKIRATAVWDQPCECTKINDCTLGDLPEAQIFVNGVRDNTFHQMELKLRLEVALNKLQHSPLSNVIKSMKDVLVPGGDDCALFVVVTGSNNNNGRKVEEICLELEGVLSEKWFEFAKIDCDNFLANPVPIELSDRVVCGSFAKVIRFFGAETKVLFHHADLSRA